jgi:heterodisulfide reductase subunit A
MARIGVFVCHCGINIASTVDVARVTAAAKEFPKVVFVTDYKYMCSDPGQSILKEAIEGHNLDRVVVVTCSPHMHEATFRKAAEEAGLNPYLVEIVNAREHVSWVHKDREAATEKTIDLVRAMVAKVCQNEVLRPISIPLTRRALVIGGGVAGIQAALDIANSGYKVILVEREPSIGGKMAQLSETFPTLDCSQCILTPKMVEISRHPKIELLTYSQVEEVVGYVGNFRVKIRKKARYVDEEGCTACGECENACPVSLPAKFDHGLSKRRAVYRPFPQAVPSTFTVDKQETAPCRVACPAGVNAQGYVNLTAQGKFKEALELVREELPFPGVCGRVCPHPCEDACKRDKVDQPIAIRGLKRFLADWEVETSQPFPKPAPLIQKERVAIVGSGPAGLTAAYYLRKGGYDVTVFEALKKPGGMLRVGIPPFRLPRAIIDYEIDYIRSVGVEIRTDVTVGKDITLQELKQRYDALFIAVGAHKGLKLGVPGEELEGVIDAIDLLRRVNLEKEGKAEQPGEHVLVIGGGNTAVDAARTALRLGSQEVTIVYRRSKEEMPADPQEIEEAEAEGVKILYLAQPVKILGDGRVRGLGCLRCELGPPDESGRRRPVPLEGSEFVLHADAIIPAISQRPELSPLATELEELGVEIHKRWGTIVADEETLQTAAGWIFAGGDAASGPSTVIEAVAAGKRAAEMIKKYLGGEDGPKRRPVKPSRELTPKELERIEKVPRVEMPKLDPAKRKDLREVELGFSEIQAQTEAKRCLMCGPCCECMECVKVCEPGVIDHLMEDEIVEEEVGAIVVATGYDLFPWEEVYGEYGYGRYKDVIDGLQFERLLSSTGPTLGEVCRPSDGLVPKEVVFVACVGGRDPEKGFPYCSKICCMYTAKQALLYKHRVPDGQPYVFYIDIRAGGKGYEEFIERAIEEDGVVYLRGRVSKIYQRDGKLIVQGSDTLSGRKIEIAADLVVLATAAVAQKGSAELGRRLGITYDEYGFFREAHPKLRPVETTTAGVFLAGACQAPKDIPEAVAQASAAASKVLELFSQKTLLREPLVATVDRLVCNGCFFCRMVCPYGAIEEELKLMNKNERVAKVNEGKCMGCGSCAAACPSKAITLRGFSEVQVYEEIFQVI